MYIDSHLNAAGFSMLRFTTVDHFRQGTCQRALYNYPVGAVSGAHGLDVATPRPAFPEGDR